MKENSVSIAVGRLSEHYFSALGALADSTILCEKKLVFSRIFRLKLRFESGDRVVFVKEYLKEGAADRDRSVEEEYRTLKFLHEKFASLEGDLNVVKPVLAIPGAGILVTEEFRGRKLQEVILSGLRWGPTRRQVEQLKSLLSQSGKWLRNFQDFTRKAEFVTVDRDSYLEEISGHLDRCRAHGMSREFLREIARFTDGTFAERPSYRLPMVGFHHDFSTWNILVGERGLAVLDFDRFGFRHRYDDLSTALVLLEGEKGVIGIRRAAVEELKDSFLAGYGKSDLDPRLMTLYTLKNAVKELGRVCAARASHKQLTARFYERVRIGRRKKVMRHCIQRLISAPHSGYGKTT